MTNNSKLQIYKGIIQYLLESTNYNLKNIADLSHISLNTIRAIYFDNQMPSHFSCEQQLVNLYHFILELKIKENNCTDTFA